MPIKKWQLQYEGETDKENIARLCGELGILEPTARLLWNRGYRDPVSAGEFIRREDNIFHDPFLMRDMNEAVIRILAAKDNNEKVMIYGDYDVDGVTSVSVLYLYLRSIGINADYHIPSRTGEGYGISIGAVDNIVRGGYTLMISVDTGITACDEIAYASSLGLDTVVTDHHECHLRLPKAKAVVNPRRPDCPYPFKDLAGVGVVFKLITALQMRLNQNGNAAEDAYRTVCNEFADLVAIGTVADVMPLVDENRLIVSIGLKKSEISPRVGVEALLCSSGAVSENKPRRITSSCIGYTLAPKINAAGRLSDASIAVELMLCNDPQRANQLAGALCDINAQRKDEENIIAKEAADMISGDYDFEKYPVIVLAKENWHHGVIGIVASRLTDKYGLPTILISIDSDKTGKGSGRSVKGLNLVEALSACGDCLEKFGGHELAAGLTIDSTRIDEFREKINEYAREHFSHDAGCVICPVDLELRPDDISIRQADELYLLEPYGTCNPAPVFVMCGVRITEVSGIGSNKHIRMTVSKDNRLFSAVYFGMSPDKAGFFKGDKADIVFSLEINEFRGERNIQLNVKCVLPVAQALKSREEQDRLYREIKNGAHYLQSEDIYPTRKEFAALYTYVKHNMHTAGTSFHSRELMRASGITSSCGGVKLAFMLDVLEEMKLFEVERNNGDYDICYNIKVKFVRGKVNLDKSAILRNLKSKQDKN